LAKQGIDKNLAKRARKPAPMRALIETVRISSQPLLIRDATLRYQQSRDHTTSIDQHAEVPHDLRACASLC
jgi:hypothetical protein